MSQTRPPLEVLVCCDGCPPETAHALRGLEGPVRVLDLPKARGYGYANRNLALAEARGDAIAWLADDDLYFPDHLERVGEVHDAGDHDLVQATCCHVRVDGFIEAMGDDWTHPFIRDLISSGGRAASTMSAITHRRELSERVGGWNAEMDAGADVDLWRRILPIARPVTIAAPTVLHLRGTGRAQSPAERIEQNRNLLERISDPVELARLRAEMGHAVYRRLADHQQEAHHLRLEAEALRKQTRDLNATLDRVVNGRWWRLRGRVLPLIRARSVVARKLDRLRG